MYALVAYALVGSNGPRLEASPPRDGLEAPMWLLLSLSLAHADTLAERVAAAARHHVERRPRLQRSDCSGLVESILREAGLPLAGNTASFWAAAEADGRTHRSIPSPGDLVFWDRTYDRDRDGRLDDPLTHIGVVMDVELDGTVLIAHRGTRTGISEIRMNLSRPDVHRDAEGHLLNSWLRAGALTGELFRGFATLEVSEDVLGPVLAGRRLDRRTVRALDCHRLWLVRNAVYARHGYRFSTERARATFAALDWYEEDALVGPLTIGAFLTRTDERNVALVLDEEARRCRA